MRGNGRDVVVIGTSMGGLEALDEIVGGHRLVGRPFSLGSGLGPIVSGSGGCEGPGGASGGMGFVGLGPGLGLSRGSTRALPGLFARFRFKEPPDGAPETPSRDESAMRVEPLEGRAGLVMRRYATTS
jgi:hypothetical protein